MGEGNAVEVGMGARVGRRITVGVGSGRRVRPVILATGVAVAVEATDICLPSSDFIKLIGMAKAIPDTALPPLVLSTLDVTTPVACPNIFSSGPPLLPGFSDASVCKRSFRLAEMIPTLTVGSCPNELPRGKPMAITVSPTRILPESPIAMGVKDRLASISI